MFSKAFFLKVVKSRDLVEDWLVVLGLNATLTAKVIHVSWRSVTHMCFSGFLTPVLTQISFQSHLLHASAEVRGENTLERNFALTRSRTHNHQVMSHQGGAVVNGAKLLIFGSLRILKYAVAHSDQATFSSRDFAWLSFERYAS